ncbi:MAG: GSCFA domain-containing protein [Lewinellaceae bacterium]|nr:GSCFA domain-containing protein [Lewinellaceae bacterium]
MPTFRTELPIPAFSFQLDHHDHILCLGSCFAQHLGGRLQTAKFSTLVNPFGVLYNPVSLGKILQDGLEGRIFSPADLWEFQGRWYSLDHHGQFQAPSAEALLQQIKGAMDPLTTFSRECNRLLLTLGTAHVWEWRENGKIVGNCHKLPGTFFQRRRLTVEETCTALIKPLEQLKAENPGLEVVLTVSPVRHLRDGAIENQRSKATLLLAAAAMEEQLPFVHYFPAYELLMDDLRDYRFYGPDLLHPSEVAIDYIWSFLERSLFGDATRNLLTRIMTLQRAAAHRPLDPGSDAHQQFIRRQLAILDELEADYPSLNWETERNVFVNQQN